MIASCIEGRIRFRHPALTNLELLQTVAGQLAALPGITGIEANLRTGSLLVTHNETIATSDLVAMAETLAQSYTETLEGPATPKGNKGQGKRRTQQVGLATCMAGALATSVIDNKAAHLTFGLALTGFAAWHLYMYRRRFMA